MNDDNLPIADIYAINDGYGVVGWGFHCSNCGVNNNFHCFYKDDVVECNDCMTEYYVDADYD